MPDIYGKLGVESKKVATKEAARATQMSKGLYHNAFCILTKSSLDRNFVEVLHADGAGSKSIVNYLMYKETGDPKWFKYNAADVIAMNIDDIVCVGCTGRYNKKEYPIKFSNTVAINKLNMVLSDKANEKDASDKAKAAVLAELFKGYKQYMTFINDAGVPIIDVGGETADLPDQTGTAIFDGTMYGVIPKKKVITGEKVAPGQVIVGFHSDSQAKYEDRPNSGIMSNGLTVVRCKLLSNEYEKKYPEIAHHPLKEPRYVGKFKLDHNIDELDMTLSEAIVSPTRIFSPLIARVIDECSPTGLVHITGGGLTKFNAIGGNVQYTVELSHIPPFFRFIQANAVGGVPWEEMCQDYNMGIGFGGTFEDINSAERAISISESFEIGAEIIGKVEPSEKKQVKVTLPDNLGTYLYLA